jgi:hypothetical protein
MNKLGVSNNPPITLNFSRLLKQGDQMSLYKKSPKMLPNPFMSKFSQLWKKYPKIWFTSVILKKNCPEYIISHWVKIRPIRTPCVKDNRGGGPPSIRSLWKHVSGI